ncbi:MAG: succinylglutamate desuccinylase/aspartoacylase family protein [Halioglobus sp.]
MRRGSRCYTLPLFALLLAVLAPAVNADRDDGGMAGSQAAVIDAVAVPHEGAEDEPPAAAPVDPAREQPLAPQAALQPGPQVKPQAAVDASAGTEPGETEPGEEPQPEPEPAPIEEQTFSILGEEVLRGEERRVFWLASETSYGSKLETPVYVIHGEKPGPTLCLTAAIHGDELNGVEIVRQVVSDLSAQDLYGTVIGVPIVNLFGFTRASRYLPDRRDLNRYFPGNVYGSSASRIAHSFFTEVVRHCDLLIDLHTGSMNRTNMPQVRANLQIPEVLDFTTKFGSTAVLHSRKLRGNLRSAATNEGIPAVALELGEPGTLQQEHIDEGIEIIETVMSALKMTRRLWSVGESQPVFYRSRWVRVNYGGLLVSEVEVGKRVREGDKLGTIANPLTNESFDVLSPYSGKILGMALNQFMLPGYAAFNVGLVADEETAVSEAQAAACADSSEDAVQLSEEVICEMDDEEALDNFDFEEMGIETEGESE